MLRTEFWVFFLARKGDVSRLRDSAPVATHVPVKHWVPFHYRHPLPGEPRVRWGYVETTASRSKNPLLDADLCRYVPRQRANLGAQKLVALLTKSVQQGRDGGGAKHDALPPWIGLTS